MIQTTTYSNFDIIGDIHGCASDLVKLLEKLGYQDTENGYQYVDMENPRQVIFVGDLVDRGSEIRRTLSIVKSMVDGGSALIVMGNHEFNAIAYHTPVDNSFLRQRNDRSNRQIQETLDEFADEVEEWETYLTWFKTMPLFLEFEHFRVVHACWDTALIENYWQTFQTNKLTDDFINHVLDINSLSWKLIDRLTKGLSLTFPDGEFIKGRDGFFRRSFRVDFWSVVAEIYSDIVFQPDPLPDTHRHLPITPLDKEKLVVYGVNEKPLFVGHYWMEGEPTLVSKNIACLDYSAVNGGKLVAYRFNVSDKLLSNANFVYVDCAK